MDKLLKLTGLCRRAGKLTIGADPVKDSVISKKSRLVLLAEDSSEHTKKDILTLCHRYSVKAEVINCTKDDMSNAVGKFCTVISICDTGFSKKAGALIECRTTKEE